MNAPRLCSSAGKARRCVPRFLYRGISWSSFKPQVLNAKSFEPSFSEVFSDPVSPGGALARHPVHFPRNGIAAGRKQPQSICPSGVLPPGSLVISARCRQSPPLVFTHSLERVPLQYGPVCYLVLNVISSKIGGLVTRQLMRIVDLQYPGGTGYYQEIILLELRNYSCGELFHRLS